VLVHRGFSRARPRWQPATGDRPHRHERDGSDDRSRRLLVYAQGRRDARVQAGRVQAGPPALTRPHHYPRDLPYATCCACFRDIREVSRMKRGIRMLSPDVIERIADELADADRNKAVIPRITARFPDATIEDSYAIQGIWRDKNLASGRTLVGRKIGLTSKAMQQATGITEPDYGVMFDDTVYPSGADIPFDDFSNVRIEVELAFVLKAPLEGPDCTLDDALAAIDYAVPALEVLNSHIELEG